jgi:subtilisin-like proprotein convertase family protein
MKTDFCTLFGQTTAVSAALMLASIAGAQVTNEIEPNDTKAQATAVNNMVPGDSLTGTTTGTSTITAGAASADYFRVKTRANALAIYRHRLTLTSSTLFQTGSIRGLSQTGSAATGGLIGTGDIQFQTNNTATSIGGRFVQWYGFGKGEEIYYRVTGTASTTAAYTATLDDAAVTPVAGPTNVIAGPVTVSTAGQGHTTDTDFWVYDANLDPVPGFGRDDGPGLQGTVTSTLAAGNYTLAISTFSFANNQAGPVGESFFGTVLDFPNAAAGSSSSVLASNLAVSIGGNAVAVGRPINSPFDVQFVNFTVVVPSNPVGSGTATPSSVPNDGTGTTVLAVTVTPVGGGTPSTGITVNADLSSIGGGTSVALLDDGVAPDATAGDNIFTASYTVPNGQAAGTFNLPFTVADAEMRSSTGSINGFIIVGPPPFVADLGNLFLPVQGTQTFDSPANGVTWFRFNLSGDVNAGAGNFVDFDTEGSGAIDTEIGVYRSNGSLVATDDDSGSGLLSQLTFGAGGRPAAPGGLPYDGLDGPLTAGTYYIAGGIFPVMFNPTGFGVISAGGAVTGVRLNYRSTVSPTNPTGAGTATPATVVNDGTGTTNLRVTVTPGNFPTSLNHTVTVDGTAIGAGTVTLLDDGVAPDTTAGDNIFNGTATVANGTAPGAVSLPFTITSDDMRSGGGNIAVTVREPTGACCVGGVATIETFSNCTTLGGTFLGDGSSTLGSGTLYSSADSFPIAIPDFNVTPGIATSTVTIADPTIINSLFVRIGLTHTFVGDLIITLSDGTTSVVLSDRAGVGTDLNGVYRFADAASIAFGTGASPLAEGDYRTGGTAPGLLSAFNGSSAAATWTLTISDNAGIDVGTITSFVLEVNPTACPAGPTCTQDYNGTDGVNGDDLADYIADFFDSTGIQIGFADPIAIPGGFAGNATAAFTGFGRSCPAAVDVPQPNPWGAPIDAYRTNGFKVSLGINNDACSFPNGDDLADFISVFFNGCP